MNALYSLYDALVSIDVPTDKARAVVDAMENDMTSTLANKAALANTERLLRQELHAARDALRQDMKLLRSSMTVRLGSMLFIAMGIQWEAGYLRPGNFPIPLPTTGRQ